MQFKPHNMKHLYFILSILALQLHTLVYSQVPSSGCGGISNEGTCFRYFQSSPINWVDSRQQCLSSGYDLATISSSEENALWLSLVTGTTDCWIGLNDIDNEGTFVWVDGSDSTYRNFDTNEPNGGSSESCVHTRSSGRWNDHQCIGQTLACYFCSIKVNVFGEVTGSTYSALSDNSILTSDTTLYCVTENMNTPEVMWSYVDLSGIRTDLTSTTDPTTGVSTIQVYTTQPGSYSCEVTEDGGVVGTYTAVIFDLNPNPVPSSGCGAISNEGTCFRYFQSSPINWVDSRQQCLSSGYDLATISSSEENALSLSLLTGTSTCWIGLNDIANEGTFVWVDGSDSTYRNFDTNEPHDPGSIYNCVEFRTNSRWNDHQCIGHTLSCYFCSIKVNVFGEVIASSYSPLSDNTILTSNTTLYCVTENMNTPEVMWSYVDLFGISTDLTSTTDPNTGISTIQVYTNQPGSYSCEVTESGGMSRTYTAVIFDANPNSVPTTGCDAISTERTCFTYWTSSGIISWEESRLQCLSRGYDLASVSSSEENSLLYSIISGPSFQCWIGLNDIENEGTFVWVDGSNSTFRQFHVNEPNGGTIANCVQTWNLPTETWNDGICDDPYNCYFCGTKLNVFGEVIASSYSPLSDNTILTSNTTLYCVTENMNTPEVMWSYVDLFGISTDLTSTTDPNTGVSTIQVYTNQPGSYSCEVTENGGMNRTYTAVIFDANPNPVPTTGCDAISTEGTCFTYWTSSGIISWEESRLQCLSRGYDLASVSSSEENSLLYSIISGPSFQCWIGLNDIENEGTFVWVDGSNSTFRQFHVNEPNGGTIANCVQTWNLPTETWNDGICDDPYNCYFCGTKLNVFGEVIASSYSPLSDNTILTSNTTLYCVTENMNTPEVMWSYVDLFGISTDLTSTTDPNTGVSTIQVYTNQPGSYSCEVTENGGMNRTYTAVIFDANPNPVPTTGCDAISTEGTCFTYWTSSGIISWEESRLQCLSRGYDLASVSSSEENSLLYSIISGPSFQCWIGLNDIENEGTFVWVDGSNSTFRQFHVNEPNGGTIANCVQTWNLPTETWNDGICDDPYNCYFCGTKLNVFGEVIASSYSPLSDNTILTSDTTLYCITENMNTPEVMWSYVDLFGISTDLTSTTDPNTGVSTIQVYTTQPGYYSCEVTESGGMNRTYTAVIPDTDPTTVPTSGCDAISSDGTCINYFTGSLDWEDSRLQCVSSGYDLVTISSSEQNNLLFSINTSSIECWIGLRETDINARFTWADGTVNNFRRFDTGQPNGGPPEQCVHTTNFLDTWNDTPCTDILPCYFCGTKLDVFGEVIASTYSALSDNTILTSDTTLYCITENMNTPEVMWSYVDLFGIRTDLTSTTDPNTGVSTMTVYTTQPGYYSCEVTESGGMNETYTAVIPDTDPTTVPTSGCDAISSDGTCINYFTGSLDWEDSRLQCVSSGYDLVTISSSEQNNLLFSINTGSIECWIGLRETDINGRFTWADGTVNNFRRFDTGQPNGGPPEQCVHTTNILDTWNDTPCTDILPCYFCGTKLDVFGEVIASSYSALSDNTILTTDTTLYCITENMNTPEVMWSYVDLSGIRTDLTSTTDPNTGISTIQVYTTQPGSYSCEVTESGGMNRTYTAVIPDIDPNTVPTSGCDAISSDGTCINYFTGSLDWEDSRLQCVSSGYDLVTISSSEQNNLLFSINTGSIECWIGLRETDINGRFTWADGTVNNFRRFDTGQPNGGPPEQCVHTTNILDTWNDTPCTDIQPCYFCGTKLDVFGEVIASTYSALSDNTILTTDTTLYCITENMNTPEVMWSYVDLSGIRTDLTSTTDPNTGISTIQVNTTQPVYYRCEVTESRGTSRTIQLEAVANRYYTYTIGIDNEDIYLFYSPADNSVQLTDIHWMIQGLPGILANPLNIYSLASYIGDMNVITLNCYDIESGNILVSVALFVQSQPLIQLGNQIITSFPLLPPDVNRADFTILSEMFYVTNWEGIETLAIQIYITAVESTQSIINLRADSSGESSVLVFWELSESNASYTDVIFSIYLGLADNEFLVGTTLFHHYEITNLQGNVNYTIRVEFQIPFSTENVSATTYHFREPIATPTNNITQSTNSNVIIPTTNPVIYIIVVGVVIIIILLLLILVIAVVVCFFMKRNSLKKSVKSQTNPQLFDLPARGNETYGQDVNVNLAYSPEKKVDLSLEKPPLEVSSPNDYST
ncbi:hypothetical protein LOD99_12372 [Oopsacas minuta]|uniref:Uncharacterized protein n=1 Tax=Oopsacas minuta TaxID=111878 RepID=A0AAV7JFE3_9METZ|nr:hypothetical protein LOD99_12372 [Oopsacas minuta]